MVDETQKKIAEFLAPPKLVNIHLELNPITARNLSFLLQEPYSKWSSELDHYVRQEDVYPAEVLELLDTLDTIRDQLAEQGIEWDPEGG